MQTQHIFHLLKISGSIVAGLLACISLVNMNIFSTLCFAPLSFLLVPSNKYSKQLINRWGAQIFGWGLGVLFSLGVVAVLTNTNQVSPTPTFTDAIERAQEKTPWLEPAEKPSLVDPPKEETQPVATSILENQKIDEEQSTPPAVESHVFKKPIPQTNLAPEPTPVKVEPQVEKAVPALEPPISTTISNKPETSHPRSEPRPETQTTTYPVISVVDGDTVKVLMNGTKETIRLIGIDTPEIGSRLECFGTEAKTRAQELLSNRKVSVELDPTQAERDRYGRLLAYLEVDGRDFGEQMIRQGYAHEYTYNLPYKNQDTYQSAETSARNKERGLWAEGACDTFNQTQSKPEPTPSPASTNSDGECLIKGNISSRDDEKIYHLPDQQFYSRTKIDPTKGERWFCTEQEALDAGWRRSLK